MITQFAFHENVSKTAPSCKMFDLYNKCFNNEKLTREEKNYIVKGLYGMSTSHSATYKYLGWYAPFYKVLPRFLVYVKYYGWNDYYSPDKTSLRNIVKGIVKIIEFN